MSVKLYGGSLQRAAFAIILCNMKTYIYNCFIYIQFNELRPIATWT